MDILIKAQLCHHIGNTTHIIQSIICLMNQVVIFRL